MNSTAMKFLYLALPVTVIMGVGCHAGKSTTASWLHFEWPAADSLFQRDRNWVGGDGAYSIDLGNGRVLWLFGDSRIDPRAKGRRRGARMVSNSLAIQHGYDPSHARAAFFWGTAPKGGPQAFFPDAEGRRYWPGHGTMVGEHLFLTLMVVESVPDGIGFAVTDWDAVLVLDPEDAPDRWVVEWLDTPANGRRLIPGSATVLRHDGHVYAYASKEPEGPHNIFLLRWTERAVLDRALDEMEWWQGPKAGWVAGSDAWSAAVPVLDEAQTELTVHFDSVDQQFVEIQHTGFGPASLTRRTASELTGPWSLPETLFTPAQVSFPNIMIYQGKAHPELEGAGLVLTYCTNSFEFKDHRTQAWLYYPRFVRVR